MHLLPALLLIALALGRAQEPVVLEAPDRAFAQRLGWAQAQLDSLPPCTAVLACDDLAVNILALNSLGRFDHARPALVQTGRRTPLWVLASHDYWLNSGDQAYIREQWPFMPAALFASADPGEVTRPGVMLAALHAVAHLARLRADSVAFERTQAALPAAERRAQEEPGVFGMALGLVDADRSPAELTLLADTVHARWPLASGLVALALYEYHRADDAFAVLRDMARSQTSTAPMFVIPLVRGLLGWDVDAPNRAFAVEPHLPAAWNALSVSNLKLAHHDIDIALARDARTYRMQLSKETSTPLSIRLAPALPRGARVTSVKVNEADVPIQLEETQHDTHVVIDVSMRREVEVEIEYTAPRQRSIQ